MGGGENVQARARLACSQVTDMGCVKPCHAGSALLTTGSSLSLDATHPGAMNASIG